MSVRPRSLASRVREAALDQAIGEIVVVTHAAPHPDGHMPTDAAAADGSSGALPSAALACRSGPDCLDGGKLTVSCFGHASPAPGFHRQRRALRLQSPRPPRQGRQQPIQCPSHRHRHPDQQHVGRRVLTSLWPALMLSQKLAAGSGTLEAGGHAATFGRRRTSYPKLLRCWTKMVVVRVRAC